ncbi:MAG: response regulator [Prosthecobacter sp.]|uniref:response regulator n=1 Tax=Prosthecobacter sp. TaxID=1965333 RepID=UPI003BAF227B
MRNPDRIVIVDNNPVSSADFRAELETQPDLTLAAAVTCASCSFAAVTQQQPDLVVISLSMPGHRVLELVKDLLVLHAGLKFLIVTSNDAELEPSRVLRAGAQGCVLSSSSAATKLEAVRQILAGHHSFRPEPAHRTPAVNGLPPLHWVNATVPL